LFCYDALSKPNLFSCPTDKNINKAVLGRGFEIVLQLEIERQNPNFAFQTPIRHQFTNFRAKRIREYNQYRQSGQITDAFLEYIISIASKRQQSFLLFDSGTKPTVASALKTELRRIHELAAKLNWLISNSFFSGSLAGGFVAAEADLILDSTLIEIKTTEDAARHNEHLSQLFGYYLISQAPIRSSKVIVVEELGIYYARHGHMIKQRVTNFAKFPQHKLKRAAFDFMLAFSNWSARKLGEANHDTNESRLKRQALVAVLQQMPAEYEWARKTLLEHYNEVRNMRTKTGSLRDISVPKDFLLGNDC